MGTGLTGQGGVNYSVNTNDNFKTTWKSHYGGIGLGFDVGSSGINVKGGGGTTWMMFHPIKGFKSNK